MAESTFRILVVDDYEPWRRVICSTFQNKPGFEIVGEVSDGEAAVQKAQELTPDLILLDIGLPRLNGIEAAREIRKLSPNSKILFVSQDSSPEFVQAALQLGAAGYVAKANAMRELPQAVNAVLRGGQFVGSRFGGNAFKRDSVTLNSESARSKSVVRSTEQNAKIARRHEVGFYSDDRGLLDDLTRFVGTALRAGDSAIVAATDAHRDSLFPRLQAYGVDIGAALQQRRYIAVDARDTLSTFMLNDMPDPTRFERSFGSLIVTMAKAAVGRNPRVAIFGECVHLLWAEGNAEAAIQMEKLGNRLTERYELNILCGYSLGRVQGGMEGHIYQRICAEHSAVHYRQGFFRPP